jgi:hypothetical protein
MKYYLETNILYNLKHVPEEKISTCFTSVFSIIEIVAGISEQNFKKRQSILKQLKINSLVIDWAFPLEVIFNSFDAFEDYEFYEGRAKGLENLFDTIIQCDSYFDFYNSEAYNDIKLGWDYYFKMDEALTTSFRYATNEGNIELKKLFKNKNDDIIEFEGKEYNIQAGKDLFAFFNEHPEVNESITVLALAKMLNNSFKTNLPIEEIHESYNALIHPFVFALSRYTAEKECFLDSSSRNDYQDLTHLLYLRSDFTRFIVSDDKFFQKYVPFLTAKLVINPA